jgi:hypothetical protein
MIALLALSPFSGSHGCTLTACIDIRSFVFSALCRFHRLKMRGFATYLANNRFIGKVALAPKASSFKLSR